MNILNGVLLSFSYFSSLPIKLKEFKSDDELYKSMLFAFPFVGMVLAIFTVLIFNILSVFFLPLYSAVVSSIIYLIMYGFLHLEAISDVVDAWFASLSGKDSHRVMKEPHVGALGAIGTFCFILLKVAIISYLFYSDNIEIFVASVILSRFITVIGISLFEFHSESTFAKTLKNSSSFSLIFFMAIFYLSFIYFVLGLDVTALTIIGIICLIFSLRVLRKKFGFLNGDCIGFSLEFTELILLNFGVII